VPWRLVTSADVPYRTTVLGGSIDNGATGVRLLGIAWLLVAIALAVLAGGVLLRTSWWYPVALPLLIVSFALCVVGWPDSRLRIIANVVILALLTAAVRVGWLAPAR
jgi:hypothetical protein